MPNVSSDLCHPRRDQTPPAWIAAASAASVDASRNLLVAGVFALAFLVCLVALAVVSTSHRVEPYVLQASPDGAIVPAGQHLVPYRPGGAERRYFLAQWARHLLAIDAHLTETWLAEAYQQTRGKATQEFTDWLHVSGPLQRLKDDPTLSRAVSILGISLIDDEVALVRVSCEERSLSAPRAAARKLLLTVHFQAVPPATEEAVLKNPIGLMVTDFQVGEDLER